MTVLVEQTPSQERWRAANATAPRDRLRPPRSGLSRSDLVPWPIAPHAVCPVLVRCLVRWRVNDILLRTTSLNVWFGRTPSSS